jgi:hypothetical protein
MNLVYWICYEAFIIILSKKNVGMHECRKENQRKKSFFVLTIHRTVLSEGVEINYNCS